MTRHWIIAAAVTGLYLLAGWQLGTGAGLVRTVVTNSTGQSRIADSRRVDRIDAQGIEATGGGAGDVTVTVSWQGAWNVPESGLHDLTIESHGASSWKIDGHLALQAPPGDAGIVRRTVWLGSGYHRIDIDYAAEPGAAKLVVSAARTGRQAAPLESLRPTLPHNPKLRALAGVLHGWLGWLALLAVVRAIRGTVALRRDGWIRRRDRLFHPRWRSGIRRALAWSALAVILVYGAVLRVDSITARFGPVTSPRWLAAWQTRSHARPQAIRPASMLWEPEPLHPHKDAPSTRYFSDPYTYLNRARHMSSFYEAFWREPAFPFVTRMFLHLLDDQDVAISFASALFSVLAIWLTYILGAAAWSRPAGLLAALGLSLDYDVISLASLGWRDDAYMAAVLLCAYMMLRCWRAGQRAAVVRRFGRLGVDDAYLEAAALGVVSGFTVLVRLMAVPFLAVGYAGLFFARGASWRRRLTMVGIATVAALVIAGPYFINCWRVLGDPIYTFNVHSGIYGAAEGKPRSDSTAAYITEKVTSHPVETLDTIAQGVTTYPFTNKWHGLDAWSAGLGEWASAAALIGIAALLASAPGRWFLLAMLASLIPFALTWKVDSNYRFTAFVYPVLLIAAAVTVDIACRAVRAVLVPRRAGDTARRWAPSWLAWAAAAGIAAAALWFVTRVSPAWVFRETLHAGETAMVTAGARDATFLDRGWSEVVHGGDNVSVRVAIAAGSLSLVLPAVNDYSVTVRMDPFPRPLGPAPPRLPVVDVAVNGVSLSAFALQWTFGRVGAYEIVLPRALVHAGVNRLDLHVRRPADSPPEAIRPGLTDGDAISLWYVRVHPLGR